MIFRLSRLCDQSKSLEATGYLPELLSAPSTKMLIASTMPSWFVSSWSDVRPYVLTWSLMAEIIWLTSSVSRVSSSALSL